ncbi:MAG: peptide chain release factor N(5)-glutamine methyltransferase [Akkermansiaceae bacterium]|nr:peptide chain release factor N(5)-glutamine methyltransferase [Akkermansiaceae bacterium]
MTSVLDSIEKGTTYLESKGIEDARRNMQLLVTHQLGCSKVELYMQFDRPMTEDELTPLREKLKRRASGEPLQHILGSVEFYRREFKTDSRALIPRPETEELVSIILNQSLPAELNLLDVGTGSGVLGLSLASELGGKCHSATLSDISHDALSLAEENTTLLGLGRIELLWSDLFSKLEDRKFHLITANLPYISDSEEDSLSGEVQRDPALALYGGKDGLDILRDFIKQAPRYLHPGGIVALEIGYDQAEAVEAMLAEHQFIDIKTHHDLNGVARFPIAKIPGSPPPINPPAEDPDAQSEAPETQALSADHP